jgi:predicted PurR-regulated permease PerM
LLPFSGTLVAAVVIGIAFYPLHRRVGRWLPRWRPGTLALLSDIIVLLLLILPSVLLIWVTTQEAQTLSPMLKKAQPTIERLKEGQGVEAIGPIRRLRVWLNDTVGIRPTQFREEVVNMMEALLQSISLGGAALAKHFVSFVVHLLLMLFILFFVFRDGPRMVQGIRNHTPLPDDVKDALLERLQDTVMGVLRGWFLTSLIQGLTAGIGYLIIGQPATVLLSCLTAVAALIPSIGTALIWLPLGVMYLLKMSYFKGLFLLIWGTFVVGLVDNFVRPYLIKNRADVPFIALCMGILGGMEVLGTKGFVIGPILFAIAPVLFAKFRERYKPAVEEER